MSGYIGPASRRNGLVHTGPAFGRGDMVVLHGLLARHLAAAKSFNKVVVGLLARHLAAA